MADAPVTAAAGAIRLQINGHWHELAADPALPLLWALRDLLGLTGTKFGCGAGLCGACTVHVDGQAVRACSVPLASVRGRAITTIEGLPPTHPVRSAWTALQVPQCGYCQPGMQMAAAALLAREPDPDDALIAREMTNLCRCGTYSRVRRAIALAAGRARAAP